MTVHSSLAIVNRLHGNWISLTYRNVSFSEEIKYRNLATAKLSLARGYHTVSKSSRCWINLIKQNLSWTMHVMRLHVNSRNFYQLGKTEH